VERLAADCALILLLLRVSQSVVLVVTLLVESFTAVFAHEGFEALMYPHVRVESGGSVERLAASLALVRLLGCVNYLVPTERACLAETFVAHFAYKWSSPYKNSNKEIVSGLQKYAFKRFIRNVHSSLLEIHTQPPCTPSIYQSFVMLFL